MPDRLGFGQSDHPPGPLSFEEFTRSTLEALDALGVEQFDAFGVHMGSCEAIELATAHPERVRRVAIVEVPAFSAEEVEQFKARYVDHPPPSQDGSHLDWYWKWWTKGGYSGGAPRPTVRPPAEVQEWLIDHLLALPEFWWGYHAAIEYPTGERVRRLTQPLLVFASHDDLEEQTERALPTLPPQAQVVDLPHFRDVLRFYAWEPDDLAEVVGHLRPFLNGRTSP
jgi:pimeloyl-ACP methyl ester carboxylesterase